MSAPAYTLTGEMNCGPPFSQWRPASPLAIERVSWSLALLETTRPVFNTLTGLPTARLQTAQPGWKGTQHSKPGADFSSLFEGIRYAFPPGFPPGSRMYSFTEVLPFLDTAILSSSTFLVLQLFRPDRGDSFTASSRISPLFNLIGGCRTMRSS